MSGCEKVEDIDDHEEDPDPFDVLMQRGTWLRQLRELAMRDEAEREAQQQEGTNASNDCLIHTLADGTTILHYATFLENQRFYDDLKHVDVNYIDYGPFGTGVSAPLLIEQDKSLGKGGICWDAAFILGEYVIDEFISKTKERKELRILELGCGTGVCGMMVAKAAESCCDTAESIETNVEVYVTDLPEILPLLRRNANLNFEQSSIEASPPTEQKRLILRDQAAVRDYISEESAHFTPGEPWTPKYSETSRIVSLHCSVLKWGDATDEDRHKGPFDLILGADIVATLYDPILLADTIDRLCSKSTVVLISFKERLSSIHRQFEQSMTSRFERSVVISDCRSRNSNPAVKILKYCGNHQTSRSCTEHIESYDDG